VSRFGIQTCLLAIVLTGCNACPRSEHQARLAEPDVVQIANAAARSAGYDLSKWQAPDAHFEYVDHDCTWFVSYQYQGNSMPGHFSVIVNDNTRSASVFGGE